MHIRNVATVSNKVGLYFVSILCCQKSCRRNEFTWLTIEHGSASLYVHF